MAKKEITTVWDDVRLWLTDATRLAIKEAEDLSRRGRLKMAIVRLSHELNQTLARLGRNVYVQAVKSSETPVALDDEARRLVREIARLESELKKRQQEYRRGGLEA